MTLETTPKTRAKRIIKTYVTPYLQQRGFEKPGRAYCRQVGRILHIFNISPSSYNKRDKYEFGVTVGVHIPGVISHFWSGPEAPEYTKIHTGHGIMHCAPGLIMVPKRAQEWEIRSGDGPEKDIEIAQDVRSVIEEGAFGRFFDRFERESDVAEFLSQPRSKADQQMFPANLNLCTVYAGVIWDQLGEYEKCKECMSRAAEMAKGKRLEADIEKLARDYVCGKLPRNESS